MTVTPLVAPAAHSRPDTPSHFPDASSQAEEKTGLRAWFRPGRVWIGTIVIPGGDAKTRYVFQVVEWNAAARRWVVSHAAHGDEQLCHLFIEEPPGEAETLRLFFSDAETKCEGALDATGAISGKVSQLVRPEEAFEHVSTANDVFRLEPAVGACFTPMVKARVHRLTRWKLARKVMPDVFAALGAAQRVAVRGGAFVQGSASASAEPARALADRLRATRLVSTPPLTREALAVVASAPGETPDARDVEAFDGAAGAFGSRRADDFAGGGDASRAFEFDDDDVETVDDGAECDERAEPELFRPAPSNEDDANGAAVRSRGLERRPFKSTTREKGHLEALKLTPAEHDWWRLWRTTQFAAEAECCALRERARRLKAEPFATRAVKRDRVKREVARGPLGGRRAAHARAHALLNGQHQLLWRVLNASGDVSPNLLNEVVKHQALALKQSEFRLHVAYTVFDDALRGFERRLPRESIERRSAVVPPGGVTAMAGAIPGFDAEEKSVAKETTCPICADAIAPGQTLCALDCQHLFHPACIQDWVHNNPSCPMCREAVLERVRGDPEDETEPETDSEEEDARETDESDGDDALPGDAPFPGAPPGFVPAAVFHSMMRAMAGQSGEEPNPPAALSPDRVSMETGDEGVLDGDEGDAEIPTPVDPELAYWRARRPEADIFAGRHGIDTSDEGDTRMSDDDVIPALIDSSDDSSGDEAGDQDV